MNWYQKCVCNQTAFSEVEALPTLDIKYLDIERLIALGYPIIQYLHGDCSLHLAHLKHQLLSRDLDVISGARYSRAVHRLIADRSSLVLRALAPNYQLDYPRLTGEELTFCRVQQNKIIKEIFQNDKLKTLILHVQIKSDLNNFQIKRAFNMICILLSIMSEKVCRKQIYTHPVIIEQAHSWDTKNQDNTKKVLIYIPVEGN